MTNQDQQYDWSVSTLHLPDEWDSSWWGENPPPSCNHEWVNISLTRIWEVCKFCGVDKPENMR